MTVTSTPLMLSSLEGLSVGDAFGERFFATHPDERLPRSLEGKDPDDVASGKAWPWTDDTAMALAVVDELSAHGSIGEGRLAQRFADAYLRESWRGYGSTAHTILQELGAGVPWQEAAARPFGGTGSKGNGAAMRAPPLGAFFAKSDVAVVVEEATKSALPTHRHPDGIAGGVVIAVATAGLINGHSDDVIWRAVLGAIADGATRKVCEAAATLVTDSPAHAATLLGSGAQVLAEDTVAYCVWCALRGRRGGSFERALFDTVVGMGDIDTTCAIVGGMLAPVLGIESIPARWRRKREPLPRGSA